MNPADALSQSDELNQFPLTDIEPLVPWQRLQQALVAHGVEAVVATGHANVTYLSDFWSLSQWSRRAVQVYSVAGVTPERDVDVVVPASNADLGILEGRLPVTRLWIYGGFVVRGLDRRAGARPEERAFGDALVQESYPTPVEALARALERRGVGASTVALEGAGLADGAMEGLRRRLPRVRFVPGEPLIRKVREVKSAREIALLRQAAMNSDLAFQATVGSAAPGMSEQELERLLLADLLRRGSVPSLSSLTAGTRTALPNGQAGTYRLQQGDLVRFDGGGRFHLYLSDIARMGIVGRATERQWRCYAAMRAGLEAAIQLVRPGMRCADIFHAAVAGVRTNGLRDYERTHVGHGIGIENYDGPHFTGVTDDVLEVGMVVCLETPYYELGWGGVQAEDTLVVTEHGAERFTTQPKELVTIGG